MMFFGWFDVIFSAIFPLLFLLFVGLFIFTLSPTSTLGTKTTTRPD